MRKELAAWLKTRPEKVQGLAAEFPPGWEFEYEGVTYYVVGYTESDRLIISPIRPTNDEDYEASMAARTYVCADHLRVRH